MSTAFKVNPKTDLAYNEDYQANSWFAIGHFEENGHTLNWLYHIIITRMGPMRVYDSNFSVYDETTGEYHYEDKVFKKFECKVSESDAPAGKGFRVECPMGLIEGDPDSIHVKAKMKFGAVDCTMKRVRDYR